MAAGGGRARARLGAYPVVKRALDISVAVVVLAVTWPIFVLAALAVAVSMGRPVFFRQARPGRHGEVFVIQKFRTMANGAGSDADRLTRVGKFLRTTSIDELPQLLNVLRGEMSLVGPRPLLPEYLPLYTARQATRHDVLPGITGLAQVSGRNDLSWTDRLELDAEYVDRRSLRLDLAILWRTVRKTAAQEGISATGEATVSRFTGTSYPQPAMGQQGAA